LSEKKYRQSFHSAPQNGWRPSIQNLRENAFRAFSHLEIPDTHQEEWRFTNLAPLSMIPFRPASPTIPSNWKPASDEHSIVLVNGRFSQELSVLPKGIEAGSLKQFSGFDEYLGKLTPYESDLFASWNTAFFNDVAVVRIPRGYMETTPLLLIYLSSGEADSAIFPRTLIICEQRAQATLVERYFAVSQERYFSNALTEVFLEEAAVLRHVKVQQDSERSYHISSIQVHQERNSSYSSCVVTLGAELSRENLGVVLDGPGTDCTLNGVYVIGNHQHTDHHTTIDHAKPYGTSRELYKGILDSRARAVFNGKIIVRKDAQKTDAEQTNKNLMLSDGARVNSTPQLEILADDVKCRHGATIGHLDEEAMFYLRSRGLSESAAKGLLMQGFLRDVTDRIPSEMIQESVNALLDSRLGQFSGVSS
jgi:Fe-S cluster assembly protein SufD